MLLVCILNIVRASKCKQTEYQTFTGQNSMESGVRTDKPFTPANVDNFEFMDLQSDIEFWLQYNENWMKKYNSNGLIEKNPSECKVVGCLLKDGSSKKLIGSELVNDEDAPKIEDVFTFDGMSLKSNQSRKDSKLSSDSFSSGDCDFIYIKKVGDNNSVYSIDSEGNQEDDCDGIYKVKEVARIQRVGTNEYSSSSDNQENSIHESYSSKMNLIDKSYSHSLIAKYPRGFRKCILVEFNYNLPEDYQEKMSHLVEEILQDKKLRKQLKEGLQKYVKTNFQLKCNFFKNLYHFSDHSNGDKLKKILKEIKSRKNFNTPLFSENLKIKYDADLHKCISDILSQIDIEDGESFSAEQGLEMTFLEISVYNLLDLINKK